MWQHSDIQANMFMSQNYDKFSLKEKLTNLLLNHDWYYQYSDNYTIWNQANEQYKSIKKLVNLLGDDGVVIYNKHAPKDFRMTYGRTKQV